MSDAKQQDPAEQLVGFLKRTGTSRRQLGQHLDVDEHALEQYCAGTLPVPRHITRYVQVALRLLQAAVWFDAAEGSPAAGDLLGRIEARQQVAKRMSAARLRQP